MMDDAIHPLSRVSIACPKCGLMTENPGVCDMCGMPIGSQSMYAVAAPAVVYPQGPAWRTMAMTLGVIAALIGLAFAGWSVVNYGQKVADKPGLKPIRSSDDLPVTQIRRITTDYAAVAQNENKPVVAAQDPLSTSLHTELAALNQRAGQLTAVGSVSRVASSAPRETAAVYPDGNSPVASLASLPEVYLESVDAEGEGSDFKGTVVIVNSSDLAVSQFDLTLQVGEKVFPLTLHTDQDWVAAKSTLMVKVSSGILGPVFGKRRVVLRAMLEGSRDARSDSVEL